jgi:hypothetical protein
MEEVEEQQNLLGSARDYEKNVEVKFKDCDSLVVIEIIG